jgi:uncharacterized protein (TIGR02001 family)
MNRFSVMMSIALMLAASPALAQDSTDAPDSAFDVSGTVSLTSDYVFRGISLSDREPAVQGSLEVQHMSGLYAGMWGSSIARYAGTNVEADIYGGWRGAAGGLDLDLGVVGYLYPGGHGANYVELAGKAARTLGPVELEAGIAWAPSQKAIGGQDNLYVSGALSSGIPGTPFTLTADVGHEKRGHGRTDRQEVGLGADGRLCSRPDDRFGILQGQQCGPRARSGQGCPRASDGDSHPVLSEPRSARQHHIHLRDGNGLFRIILPRNRFHIGDATAQPLDGCSRIGQLFGRSAHE